MFNGRDSFTTILYYCLLTIEYEFQLKIQNIILLYNNINNFLTELILRSVNKHNFMYFILLQYY